MMLSKLLGFGDLSKKIKAFILAVTLFFLSLPYGNEPIKVDYTVHTELTKYEEIIPCYSLRVSVVETNVGRPFKASSGDSPRVYVYRTVDGEKVPLRYFQKGNDGMPYDVLFKNGERRTIFTVGELDPLYEPGEYTVEVHVDHSDKVYTETITLE